MIAFPSPPAFRQMLADAFNVVRDFRDENDIGAARQTGRECQPAGLMAHQLDDHSPQMSLGRGMKPIDRLRRGRHGRIMTKCGVRADQIVVNRFGKPEDIQPLLH